ncbi:MAG: SLBB domain-containing protein, partial [Bacillota bacterium]
MSSFLDKLRKNREACIVIAIIIINVLIIISAHFYQQRQRENKLDYGKVQEKTNTNLNSKIDVNSNTNPKVQKKGEVKENEGEIVVHIVGEIKNPGVYELNEGDRVIDLIEAAGGETFFADLDQINLAEKLSDQKKVVIPKKNDHSSQENAEVQETKDGKININTVGADELQELPGIG